MKQLPGDGHKSIDVICPGFSADCLETIEEINEENREYFEEAGGERYHYIPCLNDDEIIIEGLADLVARHAGGWPDVETAAPDQQAQYEQRYQLAEQLKQQVPANV